MNLQVEVKPDFHETILVIDYTEANLSGELYLPEDTPTEDYLNYPNRFKYSESCTIDVLTYISSSKDEIIDVYFLKHHSELGIELESNSIRLPLIKDGYYRLTHIILPTLDWFEKVKNMDWRHTYGGETYNGGIYLVNSDKLWIEQVDINGDRNKINDISIVIERNEEGTTISRKSFDIFCIDKLRDCYVKASKIIFDNYANDKCNNNKNESLIFNRDFLMMTINVIQILLEKCEYEKAQMILEKLSCYNFCGSQSKSNNLKTSNCGCNKE